MGTRMAGEKGEVTLRLMAYHAARAAGSCGLNIVEVATVHTSGAPAHFVSISDDSLTVVHKRLVGAIRQNGESPESGCGRDPLLPLLITGPGCWW